MESQLLNSTNLASRKKILARLHQLHNNLIEMLQQTLITKVFYLLWDLVVIEKDQVEGSIATMRTED
jgi:hypothetical protein